MMESFFRLRTQEQIERDSVEFLNSDPRTSGERTTDREIEALVGDENFDREAAQILAIARVIDPAGWASRASFLEMINTERNGRRANEPVAQRVIAGYERCATSAVASSIRRAREVIGMALSWR